MPQFCKIPARGFHAAPPPSRFLLAWARTGCGICWATLFKVTQAPTALKESFPVLALLFFLESMGCALAVSSVFAQGIPEPVPQARPLASATTGFSSQGEAPVRGEPGAPLTIVEFADFQCPFCARATRTLEQLLRNHAGQVKLVFKNFPLDFHRDSLLAHQAALAAGAQGKFWEMHDRIFSNQRAMKRENLLEMAGELGLDLNRFESDLESDRVKAAIEADRAEGTRLGVRGTPTFFINGREIAGAASLPEFERIIGLELQAAGIEPPQGNAGASSQSPESAWSQGAVGAPLTIVWYADLASPLTPKAAQLLQQTMDAHPGKIRLVFKNRPLEFHPQAVLAHEAALAAGAQGKFWEMQELILANQGALTREDLIRYAAKLGLDTQEFSTALDQQTYRPVVDRDLAEARRRRVFGVPVFFVNGKRVDGLQPLAAWEEIVAAQLEAGWETAQRK